MNKKLTGYACFGIALGITLGAFGAHGLKRLTSDTAILNAFQTGVDYHLYHALAFFIMGIWGAPIFDRAALKSAYKILVLGLFLFSGSLYLLTLLKLNGWESRWVRPITPIGGAFLIIGWARFGYALLRNERSN